MNEQGPTPPPPPPPAGPDWKPYIVTAGIIVAVVIVWFVYHAWWVDTHCTEVLATRVCQ